jgi:hypothetical protein
MTTFAGTPSRAQVLANLAVDRDPDRLVTFSGEEWSWRATGNWQLRIVPTCRTQQPDYRRLGAKITSAGDSEHMRKRPIDPTPASYAQAMEVTGARRLLFVSGQVPADEAGHVPEHFADQARLVWRNVFARLAAAGMAPGPPHQGHHFPVGPPLPR